MDKEYLGFKELVITGEEANDLFNPESENTFGCLQNEYLIASDEHGNAIGKFKCDGHKVVKIPYKAIETRFAGKVKPRNPQQELAIDMLYDENTTVKIIAGKFGTGKDFLMCSAAIDLLERDKFEKSDFCQECGYDGEIQIVENEDGKLIWECPNCGNRDRAKMNIARRTCGYIGVNDFNQGRTQEIKERYVHLGGE